MLCAHQTGGFSDRSFWAAEHRRPRYEIADTDRANLRQAVHGVTGADQPLAHGPSNENGTRWPTENVQRRLPFNKVTGGVIVGSNGEGCGHTRQQRWMTKALSGLEDIHHLVLMA